MRTILFALVGVIGLATLVGCSSSSPPPPAFIASDPDAPPSAIVHDDPRVTTNEEVPRSIRRLVSEERVKLQDCIRLTRILHDSSGRDRATSAAFALSRELESIDSSLDSADSDRLDDLVDRIHRLSTRVSLLHDALESAL